MDDKQLVKRINSGDEKAFEKLFTRYYEPLVRFVYRYVQSIHISEELVQDVFAKLWENRKTLSSEGTIKSFLYKTTKNNALDHIRHQKVVEKYEEMVVDKFYGQNYKIELSVKTDREFKNTVQDAIEELPERPRHIFKLSRKDGLTYKEISTVLEISIKTVESHMSKALSILRYKLSECGPGLFYLILLYKNVS